MVAPRHVPAQTIGEAWAAFHGRNPDVYHRLVQLARWASDQGKRASINLLFERLRWEYTFATFGDRYRVNNNFRALYAREIMKCEVDLAGFFELRIRRSE
jgi:hypothetical protein